MDCSFMLWLFAVSVVASAFGGMLGMASGIFLVPILTMFGHIEIHTAIGASIVSVIACSCGGAAPFLRNGMTNVRLAIVLETATTMGALTGVLLAGIVPSSYLYSLFTVILFHSARQMLARRRDPLLASVPAATTNWLDSSYPDPELGHYQPLSRQYYYGGRRAGCTWLSPGRDRRCTDALDHIERQAPAPIRNSPGGAWYPNASHSFRRPLPMNGTARLAQSLATLLRYASWLASAAITAAYLSDLVEPGLQRACDRSNDRLSDISCFEGVAEREARGSTRDAGRDVWHSYGYDCKDD
jgi:sulfite exporter TauE/SafE